MVYFKRIFIIFIILLFILTLNCFAITDYSYDFDVYNYIITREKVFQDNFIFACMYSYYNNNDAWQNALKPVFDEIFEHDYDFYITSVKSANSISYRVNLYYDNGQTGISTVDIPSTVDDGYITVRAKHYNCRRYNFTFTDDFTILSWNVTDNYGINIAECATTYKSDIFISFYQDYYLSSSSNNSLLQIIASGQSETNSNLEEVIQGQEDINNNLEDINTSINNSSITSSASDLPSVNVNDPTQNGIDNIFQSIYNAFCTGQAQDIVFPIPFTNKNITLSPYYVRDMLNNNGANWVYLLIQAFWGYLIGRFIVKDISHKITIIKSGNVENIENNNIKEEML